MQTLTFIIALVALVIAIAAFYRTGGIRNLRQQMERITTKTEEATKSTRELTADALERVERLVRGKGKHVSEEKEKGSEEKVH
ncbi:MAG: hypothetical protein GTO41_10160 [Burkholderiales bacterium]|nr:hypothetical protein [Burkholderiales bacterium]